MEYQTYEQLARAYMVEFHILRDTPPSPNDKTLRGAGDLPVEALIERGDAIAVVSADMIPLAEHYLTSTDPELREGISGQFMAQATAEMQLATELLQVGDDAAGHPSAITRSSRGRQLYEAIDALDSTMASPVTKGLVTAGAVRAATAKPGSIEEAKKAVEKSVATTSGVISQHVQELGGDIAWNLVMQTSWASVVEGASLLNKDIANLLKKAKEGAGMLFARAVTVAAKTLVNVYNKIQALLGKEMEEQARNRVEEWLKQIKKDEKIDLFDQLVAKLYRVNGLKQEVEKTLAETDADIDTLDTTHQDIDALSAKFTALSKNMGLLASVLVLAKIVKIPQVLLVIAGLQISLLAVVVVAGQDYIGYKQPRFPNLTKGVAEVVAENLAIPLEQTPA